MAEWVAVAKLSELPVGASGEYVAEGRMVALFHTDEGVFALDGVCPHQGGPLGQGRLSGCVATCPWHGWQFDVRTGQHQFSPSIRQPTLPVRIVGDEVLVNVAAVEEDGI